MKHITEVSGGSTTVASGWWSSLIREQVKALMFARCATTIMWIIYWKNELLSPILSYPNDNVVDSARFLSDFISN